MINNRKKPEGSTNISYYSKSKGHIFSISKTDFLFTLHKSYINSAQSHEPQVVNDLEPSLSFKNSLRHRGPCLVVAEGRKAKCQGVSLGRGALVCVERVEGGVDIVAWRGIVNECVKQLGEICNMF